MTFKGNLKAIGLFDVFQNVCHNQLTGTLHVQSEQQQRYVHFVAGKVRLVSLGPGVGLPMRDFLVQRGYVAEADLVAARKKYRRGRPALRNVLAKERLLTPDEFVDAMHERVSEFLYDLFLLKDASFEFREGKPPDRVFDRQQRGLDLAIDPMPILVEAARRDDEWSRIRNVIGSDRDLFVRIGQAPKGNPDLEMVWNCLDGKTELSEVEDMVPFGHFEVCEAVARLVIEDRARPVGATEITAQAEAAMKAGDHAKTRALLEHAIQIERNNRTLRRMLAELYEALEDPRQAAENWAILGYQAMLEGKDDESLAAYKRAMLLDPVDIGLREKSFELLERAGSTQDFAASALDLVQRFSDLGLADRARATLDRAMQRPDLADRGELLQRLAEVERDAGRPEDGIKKLLQAAETSRRCGDRQHAELVLEIGERLFPDSTAVRDSLDNLRTNRRERRRRLVRRVSALVMLAGLSAGSAVVTFDEVMLRREIQSLARELPHRVSAGRGAEVLGETLASWQAHPFTPSRQLLRELADGLIEAELAQIGKAADDDRYLEALARLAELESIAGEHLPARRLEPLKEKLARRSKRFRELEPWFLGSHRPERTMRAFAFGHGDIEQVLALYPRLGDAGRAHARRRLVDLGSPVALPLFTDRYLRGATSEVGAEQGKVRLYDLVGKLCAKTQDRRWRDRAEVRDAFIGAYMAVAEAFLSDSKQLEGRARQLLPLFIDQPSRLPSTREGFLRLLSAR